jgi:hypothetical protein
MADTFATNPVKPVFIPPHMRVLFEKIDAQNAVINELKVKIDAMATQQLPPTE